MHSHQNKSQQNITLAKNDTGKTLQPTVNSPAHINDIIQRAQIAPESLTHNDFMTLHHTIGNRAVAQLMNSIAQKKTQQDTKPPLLINSNAQEHTSNDTKPPIQEKETDGGVIQEVTDDSVIQEAMKQGKEYPYVNEKSKEHIHKYGKDFHVQILVDGKMKRLNVIKKGKVHQQAKEAKKRVMAHKDEEFIKKFKKALGKHTIESDEKEP